MTKVVLPVIPTLLNISDFALRNDKQNTLRNVNIRGKQYARKSSFLFGNEAHTASLALCPSAPKQARLKSHLKISVSP
jgi:predicted pyridoxine 5'-phosphate oxidase superfamily flavin-nucleotide-binding protein